MPTSNDVYDVYPDHVIVHSKSGNDYLINDKLQCTCKGYGYREECRHVNHVIEHGLLHHAPSLPPVSATEVQNDIMRQLTKGTKG